MESNAIRHHILQQELDLIQQQNRIILEDDACSEQIEQTPKLDIDELNEDIQEEIPLPTAATHEMVTHAKVGVFKPNPKYIMQMSTSPTIPNSVNKDRDDPNWTKAMDEEMGALNKNHTWV